MSKQAIAFISVLLAGFSFSATAQEVGSIGVVIRRDVGSIGVVLKPAVVNPAGNKKVSASNLPDQISWEVILKQLERSLSLTSE